MQNHDQRKAENNARTDEAWIAEHYPIHWAVWNNDFELLKSAVLQHRDSLEAVDPHGKTPLLLAVCLDHFECAKYLLEKGARSDVRHRDGWSAVHEATCTGDVELLSLILQYRDAEKLRIVRSLDKQLMQKLRDVPDFYVEMKWEFSSWIPLVARFCPSDVCRIYKKGASVRLDTTLIGFEGMSWQRGLQSFLFVEDGGKMSFHEIDHTERVIKTERSQFSDVTDELISMDAELLSVPSDAVLKQRMRTPVMLTTMDSEKIQFDWLKTGLIWKADREDNISGRCCKVCAANNVTFITRSRSEHLTETDKERLKKEMSRNPIGSYLSKNPENGRSLLDMIINSKSTDAELPVITAEQYFDASVDLAGRDVGRPHVVSQRSKSFKANMWLCEDYPLSLNEQILPIIDMMSAISAHFAKVRDFISLAPPGFPLKIEIPLFHVLTAKITFENIFGSVTPVEHVESITRNDGGDGAVATSCRIADEVFALPEGYERQDASWRDDLAAMLEDEQDGDFAIPDDFGKEF